MLIHVEKPSPEKLASLGVENWPVWEKEVSEFAWFYDETESCFLLQGKVIVIPQNGEPVSFAAGDFVVFPQGMHCTWKILEPVRKHYNFG